MGVIPAEDPAMGPRPDSTIPMLTAGKIGPSTGMLIGELTGWMDGIRTDMLTEVRATVVVTLGNVVPACFAVNVRAGTVFNTGGVMVDVLECTVFGAGPDVDASMWVFLPTASKFMTLRVSLDEILLCCWTGLRCRFVAVLNCRVLQA